MLYNANLTAAINEIISQSFDSCISRLAEKYGFDRVEAAAFIASEGEVTLVASSGKKSKTKDPTATDDAKSMSKKSHQTGYVQELIATRNVTTQNPNAIKFKTTRKRTGEYDYTEHTWDFSRQLDIDEYLETTSLQFELCAKIAPRYDEKDKPEEKRIGYTIELEEWFKLVMQGVYLITIGLPCGEMIVKGGKMKNGLKGRTYPAGTEFSWTAKAGTDRGGGKKVKGDGPSGTNYIFSQIFRMCIKENISIKFYGISVPTIETAYPTSTGEKKFVEVSPYEETEKDMNAHLIKALGGKNPIGAGDLLELHKN